MEPKQQQPPAPQNESELVQAVGEWSVRNFRDRRAPEFGIVEEIGEATHCVLKRFQKIRGFENEEFFLTEFTDALADTVIYLCDWCYSHQAFFKFGRNHVAVESTEHNERRVIMHLLQVAAGLMAYTEVESERKITPTEEATYCMLAQRVATGLEFWAEIYKIDLRLAVAGTWAKVVRRDWLTRPQGPEHHLR